MIKVRLLPDSNINVRLKPTQGIKVGLSTTYLYDPSIIQAQVDLSKDWAIKVDGKVSENGEEIDYSAKAWAIGGTGTETNNSKYYSEQAATSEYNAGVSEANAATSATNSQIWAEGTDIQVETLGGEHSSKVWALVSREYTFGGAYYDSPNERIVVSESVNDLAEVAKTGDYEDLINQPTIGDATLTIQKNSVTVDTFKANATTDKTINITVPTSASDVNALPSSTKYGSALSLSINSTTYVVTAQLKDQDGNNLGTAQTIDLPLESVVVSGSYDDDNKEIVLTLQSGATIEIPVADLVAGLQAEITSQNKLSSDLVDDTNKTNKFVTAQEKTTWNNKQPAGDYATNTDLQTGLSGKQDTINDLDTIRDGASAGATAVQPATLQSYAKSVNNNTPDEDGNISISIPSDTSQLTNGAGYVTASTAPVKDVQLNGTSIVEDGVADIDNDAEVELGRLHVQGKGITKLVSSDNGFVVKEVPAPLAADISAVAQAGSGLEVGTYYYTVTFVTAVGETNAPAGFAVTTTSGNQQVKLTIPVSTDYRVIARKVYRSTVSSGQYNMYLEATINNNTNTQHVDSRADSALDQTKTAYFRPNTTSILCGNYAGSRYMNLDYKICTLGKNVWNQNHTGGRSVYLGANICEGSTQVAGAGNDNVAVGQTCMRATSGSISRCTALGSYAMSGWSGTDNIAIGYQALYNGSSLNYNVSIGNYSNSKGGNGNVSVGHQTRRYCTGSYNVAVGYNAAVSTSGSSGSGANNVAVGTLSMANMASASNNTALGNRTCENISTGSNNVCVGNYAGNSLQGGSYNVFLGCDAGRVFQNPAGRLVIDAYSKSGADDVADKSIIYGQMYIASNAQNQWLYLNADVRVQSLRVKALNTAPSSSTDTGTAGEIRICSDAIYVCVATNTWKKCALTSF